MKTQLTKPVFADCHPEICHFRCEITWLERTWLKGSLSLASRLSTDALFAPLTVWNGATKRFADGKSGCCISQCRSLPQIDPGSSDGDQRGVAERKSFLCWQVTGLLRNNGHF